MAQIITPSYNPSMALLGGWPYSSAGGDGHLGNDGSAANRAVEQPASKEAAQLKTAKATNSSARIV